MELFNATQKLAFGIDLGTTNSAISISDGIGRSKCITLTDYNKESTTLPSCVMWKGKNFKGENIFVVGREAYENKGKSNVVYSIKSHMEDLNYKARFEYNGQILEMTPAEVSAEILKDLVKKTNNKYGTIKDVVITVPAQFNQTGINATKEACTLAGLNCISILREPTSASLCYIPKNNAKTTILVFDLGGGTFDVSIVKLINKKNLIPMYEIYDIPFEEDKDIIPIVDVCATKGNTHLGGDDLDNIIIDTVIKKADKKYNLNLTEEEKEELKCKYKHWSERNKKDMCNCSDNKYIDNTSKPIEYKGKTFNLELSTRDLKEAIKPIYDKTKKLIFQALSLIDNKIDAIILVGGSTKNKFLREMLSNDIATNGFQNMSENKISPQTNLCTSLEPDESIALGAGIYAGMLKYGNGSRNIIDVLPLGIGVIANENGTKIIKHFINGNSKLPARGYSDELGTIRDNQKKITVNLYQGNSKLVNECQFLGSLVIDNIPDCPKDTCVPIEITVNVDNELHCFAHIGDIKKEIKLQLGGTNNSTQISIPKEHPNYKLLNEALMQLEISFENDKKELKELILDTIKDNSLAHKLKEKINYLNEKQEYMKMLLDIKNVLPQNEKSKINDVINKLQMNNIDINKVLEIIENLM